MLGTIEVVGDGGPAVPLPGRLRHLLAALVVSRGQVVPAERLADVLWGDDPPVDAAAALHNLLSRLRRTLVAAGASGSLRTRPPGYVLEVERDAVDADRFERLVTGARARLRDDPLDAARQLDAAAALWRGEAYAELGAEDFARPESARLASLRAFAAEDRVDADLLLERPAEAIARLAPMLAGDPLRERAQAQLVLARYRVGQHAAALDAYRTYARGLADELGLEPSAAMRDLQSAVLRHDPRLGSPEALVLHRVGSTARGGDHTAHGGDTGSPRAGSGGRLPPAPDLVGRESDLSTLTALVRTGRVVTLTGPGGVGKTSLVVRLAHDLASRYPDGARVCELAALTDPESVAEAVGAALGVHRRRDTGALDRLVEYLRPQRLLLVLDNCEHLLHAAAALADAVRLAAPAVSVVATSREPLGIPEEHVHPVAPLSEVSATRLFVARARQATTGFDVDDAGAAAVAEICRRLDRLPLAIELAANRMRAMSPADLVDRLSWRFRLLHAGPQVAAERHRTLGALVDWSYGLLDETQRRVFDTLTVFAGDFTLEAAEAVVPAGAADADPVAPVDAGDVVLSLVDRSMVAADTTGRSTHYVVLETLRAYGRPRLEARPQARAVHHAHATYYADLAAHLGGQLFGPGHADAARAIDAAVDELRAAHAWALAEEPRLAARLVGGLARYLECRLAAEVPRWAERTLEQAHLLPPDDSPSRDAAPDDAAPVDDLLAQVLGVAAAGARFAGDLATARRLVAAGLPRARSDDVVAYLHFIAGEAALFDGDLAEAERLATEISRLVERGALGGFGDVARSLEALVPTYRGDVATGLRRAEQMQARSERAGAHVPAAWAKYLRGEAVLDTDPVLAGTLLREAVTVARRDGDGYLDGVALVSLASLHSRHGEVPDAVTTFREVVEHWHRVGDWTHQWTTVRGVVDLLVRLGRDEEAAVLLGAVRSRTTSAEVFGDDAARLRDAEGVLAARLGAAALGVGVGDGRGHGRRGRRRLRPRRPRPRPRPADVIRSRVQLVEAPEAEVLDR